MLTLDEFTEYCVGWVAAMQQAIINSIATCQALREDTRPVQFCLVTRANFTEPVTL